MLGFVALGVFAGGVARGREVVLEVDAHRISAGRLEAPAAWLKTFLLEADRTVLHGHDGEIWALPAASVSQWGEIAQALRLVAQPAADAWLAEHAAAVRAREALSMVRPTQQT